MGLMLLFPVSEDEVDRVEFKDGSITLKTYGLPMVFWSYLAIILITIITMGLVVKGPMISLFNTNDPMNKAIVIIATLTIIGVPFVTTCAYFYEKFITKNGTSLIITHRLFWIPVLKKTYTLESSDSVEVLHHMDSPNIAKIKNDPALKGFQNKGYFQLFAKKTDGKFLFLDRGSRKADLEKIKTLLSRY